MALGGRTVEAGLIFHSDRGRQYVDSNVRTILIFSRRRVVQMSVHGADDATLERLETVLAPSFQEPAPAWPAPEGKKAKGTEAKGAGTKR